MCLTVEDQTFGEKLKTAREQSNLTRIELAEKIGSSSKTVARWERGETLPRPQFHQKLCTVLNTSLQALGLETKTVTKRQHSSRSQQSSFSTPSSDTLPMHGKKKGLRIVVFTGSMIGYKSPPTLETEAESHWISTMENDAHLVVLGSGLLHALRLKLYDGIRAGKSSVLSSLFNPKTQKESQKPALPAEVENVVTKLPTPHIHTTSIAKTVENKALYCFCRGKVFLLAQADGDKHISYIAENLASLYQYVLITNLYGIILPNLFTPNIQVDIGGIVTTMTNIAQVIHQVLSDPALQGIGVVVSIVLPIVIGYKKKSSMVASFFASTSLAA